MTQAEERAYLKGRLSREDELMPEIERRGRLFPLTRFASENTTAAQIAHVISEATEATQEDFGSKAMVRELLDLHHSLETLWEVVKRERGALWLEEQREWVEDKNRRRGYYK